MFKTPKSTEACSPSSPTQPQQSNSPNSASKPDSQEKPTYDQLLEQFERLCILVSQDEDEDQLDPAIFDLTQDDSELFLKVKVSRSQSAPQLSPPPSENLPNTRQKVPFVFMFDPSTSRAGQARLPSTTGIEDYLTKDSKLQNFYQRCKGLTFTLFMEEYSLYAKKEQYSHEQFLSNLALLAKPFTLSYSNVEEGLSKINESYCKVNRDFFCKLLQALCYDIEGASRMQLFISLHKKHGPLELIKGDEGYQSLDSSTMLKKNVTGKYSMVIIEDEGQKKILIGHGLHFNIAQGRKTVLFAGNIEFSQDGQVLSIDDHSGGYHGLPQENKMVRASRKKSLAQLLEEVGLPGHCFNSQFDESISLRLSRPNQTGSDTLPFRKIAL